MQLTTLTDYDKGIIEQGVREKLKVVDIAKMLGKKYATVYKYYRACKEKQELDIDEQETKYENLISKPKIKKEQSTEEVKVEVVDTTNSIGIVTDREIYLEEFIEVDLIDEITKIAFSLSRLQEIIDSKELQYQGARKYTFLREILLHEYSKTKDLDKKQELLNRITLIDNNRRKLKNNMKLIDLIISKFSAARLHTRILSNTSDVLNECISEAYNYKDYRVSLQERFPEIFEEYPELLKPEFDIDLVLMSVLKSTN